MDNYEATQKSREPASPIKKRLKAAEARAAQNAELVLEVGSEIRVLKARLDFLEKHKNEILNKY